MTQVRQLPLFIPTSENELNRHTKLRESISLFQKHLLKAGKSDHTVNAFTSDLQLLAEWGGSDKPLGDYTTPDLNHFLEWLEYGRGVPCSRKSYARRVTTLKVFFKWLCQLGVIPADPANVVLQRSGPAPLAEILTFEATGAVLLYGNQLSRGDKPDARPLFLFRLILETGIKKSEAMRLTPKDIERPRPPALRVRQKANDVYKERRIELEPSLLSLLDTYVAQYQPRDVIFNCTARNLEYILEDLGAGAGVPHKISFEMLRWMSAVRDYQAGIDPDRIREKLGLSRISWVETFSKVRRLAGEEEKE
jgi:site-specific recombinase XerD